MESRVDFLYGLDSDTSLKILKCLDDPSDLARVSCVSRSWRHYVVANGLCKQLCLKMFPPLSKVVHVVELNEHGAKGPAEVGSSHLSELQALERDHRVYGYFARASTTCVIEDCIAEAISASSTDHFPGERIANTLEPRNIVYGRASYWSSKGESNPSVPEILIYKLASQICVITEINIRPFEVFFDIGSPICSAKSVRFRMGLSMLSSDISDDEKFVWTYTSPVFPMAQESSLQTFKLPEPVLCIGGILQIELLGRAHRCEIDGLFYICIAHVQAMGLLLSPAFSVEDLQPSGRFVLKHDHLAKCHFQSASSENEPHATSSDDMQRQLRDFQQTLIMLHGNEVGVEEDDSDVEDEMDELEEDDWDVEHEVVEVEEDNAL